MGKMKKKYESGAATAYIARNQAIKKLQLTIADFRRLCILKGVYPVQPKNKKKVNKGKTTNRTFYYSKDISYLANEPIINKFRAFKIYVKRLKRAQGKRDIKAIGHLHQNKPSYKIDHIVKERYPTFMDAMKDLDDCLSLVFLFATLPKSKRIYVEKVQLCQRLSLEFMHYIIASKSLRKCFISIKGYYFQAEIKGQTVTWIMPHKLAYQVPDDVDFRIMSTFVEFYTILLGFVNYKLYTDVELIYPPKLRITNEEKMTDNYDDTDLNEEFLASLNRDFIKISESPEGLNFQEPNDFPLDKDGNEKSQPEFENDENKITNLFQGLKFFLNREIPREQFVLAIRSFSGTVSWDKSAAMGATYEENDTTITHQIIDRPLASGQQKYLNRVYVQPQWIFDCINEKTLLPVDDYLPGAVLPSHLSPFVVEKENDYVTPEKNRLAKLKEKFQQQHEVAEDNDDDNLDDENKNDLDVDLDSPDEEEDEDEDDAKDDNQDSEEDEEEEPKVKEKIEKKKTNKNKKPVDTSNSETKKEKTSSSIAVVKGKPIQENLSAKLKKQSDEDRKLTEMTLPKKQKRLYDKIMKSRKIKSREVDKLAQKRKNYEESIRSKKKI